MPRRVRAVASPTMNAHRLRERVPNVASPTMNARRLRERVIVGSLAVAATFAHHALWTASGLENGLYEFLLALSLVLLAH